MTKRLRRKAAFLLPRHHGRAERNGAARLCRNCLETLFLAAAIAIAGGAHGVYAENVPPAFEQWHQAYPRKRERPPVSPPARVVKPRPARQADTPPPTSAADIVEKRPDARTIMVVGDFLASELAAGLTDAYAKSPGVVVVDKANGSSGFVRNDFYDWDASIGPLLDTVKPAVVVMMIGSNDRQSITMDGKSEAVRSDEWVKEYNKRVKAFAATLEARRIPLVWVGVPAFRSSSMSSDMLAFNGIYQNIVDEEKGTFVDIWDGFVDNNGAFTLTGPDVNGQPTRLRLDDGINFSRAGKAKAAFYVEKDLNRLLGDAVSPDIGSLPPAGAAGPETAPGEGPAQRTPPISLKDQGMEDGSALDGATVTPALGGETAMERLTVEGIASAPPHGRADNFGGLAQKPALAAPTDDDAITRIILQSQRPQDDEITGAGPSIP